MTGPDPDLDRRFMAQALGLARRAVGTTAPNPPVGCVIVRDGVVVGYGWTQPGGRPHAETEALALAGADAEGATAYVTLEPCSHHGRTPPCADALVAAGIVRAVVAIEDPDARVSGRGLARLAEAGIAVETGLMAEAATEVAGGFLSSRLRGRPEVTLKLATTLDGRIATHAGESRWITGPEARAYAHGLRARHDGILVGIGTALADDPELTCRLPGLEERSPWRIVLDSRLGLPLTSRLVASASEVPTLIVAGRPVDPIRARAYVEAGVRVLDVETDAAGMPEIGQALVALGTEGLTRLLVEGGSRVAAELVRAGAVDRLVWIRAGSVMGGDGLPAVAAYGIDRLADLARFRRVEVRPLGADLAETYLPHAAGSTG